MTADLISRRLHQQGISHPIATDVAATARHLLAVQAQDYHGSLFALGLRTQGAREADVEQAIGERRIVRTWPMRGTLHWVAAEDARWLLALLASRALARDLKRQEREFGLDAHTVGKYGETVVRLLEGGRRMTRPALYAALAEQRIDVDGPRGLHILGRLAHEGLICLGDREGKQPTFVLLDEWLPPSAPREREAALAELAQRYFAGHGPATVQDLSWWSGLTVADARAALELARPALARHVHDGREYWFVERAPGGRAEGQAGPAYWLPPFDEYLIGYRDRDAVIDAAHLRRVIGINGLVAASAVLDGRVVALWKRTLGADGLDLALAPLRPLRRQDTAALRRAAKDYGRFLDKPVRFVEE